MIHEDSRRLHRRTAPERLRYFGKSGSSTSIRSPYGGLPNQVAGTLGSQQITPLLQGLGTGMGSGAQRLNQAIASGKATGPLASAIQQIQQFAPGVISGAQQVGQQMSQQGQQAVQGLQTAINQAMQQMPQYQQAVGGALGGAQQGLTAAEQGLAGAQAQLPGLQAASQQGLSGLQQALGLAGQAAGGPATQGAQQAMNLAQQYAQQAASPIGQEDLYQTAARRVMQQINPGLAARGLEAGGSGAQAQTDAMTNLAYQFAANRAQQQQQTQQALGQAAANLGNVQQQGITGLETAGGNVQAGAQNAGTLANNVLNPWVQGIGQAAGNVGNAAQMGANLAMAGPQLAQQQAQAVQQLGQALMQQYQLPMQSAGSLLNLLTAGTQPGLSMLDATRPIALPSSSSKQYL